MTGPVTAPPRSLAPDLARGSMLLLIALAHVPPLLVGGAPGFVSRPLGETGLDHVVDAVMLLLVDNRSYPMFGALFGYGLATIVARQLARGSTDAGARRVLRRRGWYLLLFGLLHASVLGGADVLGFYGVATLLVGGLLFRSDRALGRTLVVVGAVYLVLMPVLWIGVVWGTGSTGFVPPADDGGYLAGVAVRFVGYPAFPLLQLVGWPMLVGVLAGMWAGRRRLLERAGEYRPQLRRAVVAGVAVSVLGGVPGALIGAGVWQPGPVAGGVAVTLHVLTGVVGGLAYTAAFGLAGHALQDRQGIVTWALAALGKRSLTFYVLQEAMLFALLAPAVLGLGAAVSSAGGAAVAVGVWLTGLVLACLLERAGRPGPLDGWLRSLTYRAPRRGEVAAGR
ncbi:hypothetical protein Ae168Ps1_1213 [Pseudonocardia sp. Ae168_Ps1]|uniref:DUF418 domain-containing protein n=1 Tax=unclassified Pseudonocardia TaxID=2619320 RepID=UPI00095A6793|nr:MULTISPECIES: DUF418 domain-containing protein [unclassified Pseudonocardia]OLL72832.1 hypothetical protein Ae150APs1_1210 [Pseudonocardia sp. Ae150A_Ps1]OLL78807.1 hypothetical protein Ae168Ps1_1213 [Pseudonocardia sp. Ae168_Ps1]OLL87067.1 hypothetical protein Ae263Ps1_4122c [Pseudonocardia sp. Ae263_Ps1]OLL92902.1 hypothetical protein Ae356Ps1_2799 [Pseudonocardia sp. Ae356_Ps1]